MTNSFYFRCVGINKFTFFGLFRHFFLGLMDAHFFGRALSRWLLFLQLGCVLEETHGTTYLEVAREVLKEGQEL